MEEMSGIIEVCNTLAHNCMCNTQLPSIEPHFLIDFTGHKLESGNLLSL